MLGARRTLAFLLLSAGLGCGGGSFTAPEPAGASDAGPDSAGDASAPPHGGTRACNAADPTGLACNPSTEICVDDYSGAGGFNPHQQCKPIPSACATDQRCACVLDHFECGITTTCSDADGGTGGIVRVTCQPD